MIRPLVALTTPDDRTVQRAVDGHGVRGRACSALDFGVSLTVIALLSLSRVI
ncbi:hypothetical protein SAMN06272781_2673 [Streptomyces sp. 1222.2]|uniref:hypothetical protein n=1 Tax=Streptomyces sp. 1222.2 TaxID=1938833 RepID=UPI000BD6ADE7|nr:hypothetical protein [Streptomyces sp. 1222.2]SOD70284.1 hypothetical protein SAMN06272781_2673 [Streptomyces sp. 1222.2]